MPLKRSAQPPVAYSPARYTVKVGGRYFVLLTIENLAAGWQYAYGIFFVQHGGQAENSRVGLRKDGNVRVSCRFRITRDIRAVPVYPHVPAPKD